jgi:L-ascorbate metabolism protein UlaG (beta-lactamase superfamily)
MKIKYHGHSHLQVFYNGGSLVIDPFITGNPLAKVKPEDIKCDYIILTHAHGDHYGDADAIAKKNDATIITVNELALYCASKGLKSHTMHVGGGFNFPFGRVKLTVAHHSSTTNDGKAVGDSSGVLLAIEGKTIYHSGDTALFSDMKLIGEMNKIDVAFLPIGDNFTMGIDDAVKAVEFINPSAVVPIHYNTFDIIKADPEEFKRKVESIGKKCVIMSVGDEIEI